MEIFERRSHPQVPKTEYWEENVRNAQFIIIGMITFGIAGCSGFGISTDPSLSFTLIEGQDLEENIWGEADEGFPDKVAVESFSDSTVADVLRGADDGPGWNGYGAPGEPTPRLEGMLNRIMYLGATQRRDTKTASRR